jgi:hypothetical protein
MQQPIVPTRTTQSPPLTSTCPLCDRRAGSFIADHRGLPRHQLRNGYACECAGRFTVPVDEDFALRQRDKAQRDTVAGAVRREWARGVTVNLDRETFRRLLLEDGAV